MKIKVGFVSNSSSSSFIIQYKNWMKPDKILLTEIQIQILENYGFKRTYNRLWDIERQSKVIQNKEGNDYGYYTLCNQDYVIEFLIKNKIPFQALCHYGNEVLTYDGNNLYEIPNLGNRLLYQKSNLPKKYKVDLNSGRFSFNS